MAVYTRLENSQINTFLETYFAAKLINATPINEGTDNTNYLLTAVFKGVESKLVLTLFENLDLERVINCCKLMQHLATIGLKVPAPLCSTNNSLTQKLVAKTCIVTPYIKGQHPQHPSLQQCSQIAENLGTMHTQQPANLDFASLDLNTLIFEPAQQVQPSLPDADEKLLAAELALYQTYAALLHELPQGIIHSDLFRDNTLFVQQTLTAILDFYSAAKGFYLYDLAVLINDWCFRDGQFSVTHYHAICKAYNHKRPLNALEQELLPIMLRIAATRFWLSRWILHQQYSVKDAAHKDLQNKSPERFKQRLIQHISASQH